MCSETRKYLYNLNYNDTIKDKMLSIYKMLPEIKATCECYHYKRVKHTETDDNGRKHTYYEDEKVVSASGEFNFEFCSCRDVSGLFSLGENISKKTFLQLELEEEINFEEDGSYSDYSKGEKELYNKYRSKDKYFDTNEIKKIKGLTHHQLLFLGNGCSCFFKLPFFVFLTIIPFAEFFKICLNSSSLYKNFTIRKVVSSRNDLSSPTFNEKYDSFNPQIDIISNQIIIEPNIFIYTNYSLLKNNPQPIESTNKLEQDNNQIKNSDNFEDYNVNKEEETDDIKEDNEECKIPLTIIKSSEENK